MKSNMYYILFIKYNGIAFALKQIVIYHYISWVGFCNSISEGFLSAFYSSSLLCDALWLLSGTYYSTSYLWPLFSRIDEPTWR
jgi:hypothetical protein